jgi:alpha-tubulin suppressor-like RCC1 family protein
MGSVLPNVNIYFNYTEFSGLPSTCVGYFNSNNCPIGKTGYVNNKWYGLNVYCSTNIITPMPTTSTTTTSTTTTTTSTTTPKLTTSTLITSTTPQLTTAAFITLQSLANTVVAESYINNQFIIKNGLLYSQGFNANGELGNGTIDLNGGETNYPYQYVSDISNNWVYVKQTSLYTVLGIKNDGTLWGWGPNNNSLFSISPTLIPTLINFPNKCKYIYPNADSFFVLDINNDLWAFGTNLSGALGVGTNANVNTLTKIIIPTKWKMVTSFSVYPDECCYLLDTDGYLWQTGKDFLGNINYTPFKLNITNRWLYISANKNCFFGIDINNKLWFFGYTVSGLSGDGTNIRTYQTLIQISTASWKQVESNDGYAYGIQTDGSFWGWGYALINGNNFGNTVYYQQNLSLFQTPKEIYLTFTKLDSTKIWKNITCRNNVANYFIDSTNSIYRFGNTNESFFVQINVN